jgi:hypothetical protein
MAFNLELLKEHPYATGTVVIVGGVIVFYLLSSSSSSSTPGANSQSSDYAATLNADSQLAQVQAGAQVQTNAQQVALQQAQLEAQVSNTQTAASLQSNDLSTAAQLAAVLGQISGQVQENNSNNYTAVTEQANTDVFNENVVQMQDSVLNDQINAGVVENANNNATNLGADELGTQLATLQTTDTYNLEQQQEALQTQGLSQGYQLAQETIQGGGQQAGTTAVDILDAAYGSPQNPSNVAGIVESGNSSAAASSIASSNALSSILSTATKTSGSVLAGLFG